MYTGKFGKKTITSEQPFVVLSPKRGKLGEHCTREEASEGVKADVSKRLASGGFSDAAAYELKDGQWVPAAG
jgi:hypothetical protein